jgi:hypothetical protein
MLKPSIVDVPATDAIETEEKKIRKRRSYRLEYEKNTCVLTPAQLIDDDEAVVSRVLENSCDFSHLHHERGRICFENVIIADSAEEAIGEPHRSIRGGYEAAHVRHNR